MATKMRQKLRVPWLFTLIKRPHSLRTRLVLWNSLILLLTLIILSSIIYSLVTYYLQSSQDQRLEIQGEKLQLATTIWLLAGHPINTTLFNQLVQSAQQDEFTPDPLYVKIFDARTGKQLQRSPNLQKKAYNIDKAISRQHFTVRKHFIPIRTVLGPRFASRLFLCKAQRIRFLPLHRSVGHWQRYNRCREFSHLS